MEHNKDKMPLRRMPKADQQTSRGIYIKFKKPQQKQPQQLQQTGEKEKKEK